MSTQNILDGVDVQGIVDKTQEALAGFDSLMDNGQTQKQVIQLVLEGDTIALMHLRPIRGDAEEHWQSLSWQERCNFLRTLNDSAAEKIVSVLDRVESNTIVKATVVKAVEIARRAILSQGFRDLLPLYQELLEQKAIKKGRTNPETDQDGKKGLIPIQVILEREETFLHPNVAATTMAWTFLQEANREAKTISEASWKHRQAQRQEMLARTEEMKDKVSFLPLLTICRQGKGDYLLQFPDKRSAHLMFSEVTDEQAVVEILMVNYSPDFSWRPIRVNLPDLNPIRGRWPDGYQLALKEKFEKERTTAQAKERTEPITSIATFPIPFSGQGLTRLLNGEEGIIALWENKFSWEGKEGLFALALERKGKQISVAALTSDISFSSELVGVPLNIEKVEGKDTLLVTVYTPPDVSEDIRKSYKLLHVTLTRRLRAELNAAPSDKRDNDTNGG